MALAKPPVRVRLRPTMASDVPFVLEVERRHDNQPWIIAWEKTQHEAAIRFPDFRHFIIEAGQDYEPEGFVILVGCRNPHQNLELKRMVIGKHKGQGIGQQVISELKRIAFNDLGAHRLWLDVREHNHRARALYQQQGFVDEGMLREAVNTEQGYQSLVVMSMLKQEYDMQISLREKNEH